MRKQPTDEDIHRLRKVRGFSYAQYKREEFRNERGWIEYETFDSVARATSLQIRMVNAQAFAQLVWPHILRSLESGLGWKATATALNKLLIPTRRGKRWDAQAVRRVAKRMGWQRPAK